MFQLSLSAGNPDSNLLEAAVFLDSLCSVLKWIFFIIVILVLYNINKINYKKRNANPRQEKHSKNTNRKER